MSYLVVRHEHNGKTLRSFKVRADGRPHAFGASHRADLCTPSIGTLAIEGFLICKDNSWSWHNMTEAKSKVVQKLATETGMIPVRDGQLHYEIVNNTQLDWTKLKPSSQANKRLQQIYLMYVGEQLHQSVIKDLGEGAFGVPFQQTDPQTSNWVSHKQDNITIMQRTAILEDHENTQQNQKRIYTYFMSIAATIGVALLMITQMKGHTSVAVEVAPTLDAPVTIVTEVKPKEQKPQQAAPPPPEQKQAQAGSGRSAPQDSIGGSRMTKLLAKIAIGGPKSAHLIANGGKEADLNMASALALRGPVERDGKQWGLKKVETGNETLMGSAKGKAFALAAPSLGNGGKGISLLADESEVSGGLDPEIIAQYIRSKLGQILYCYERRLTVDPNLAGKVSIRFGIRADGSVDDKKIHETSLKSAEVESCILNQVASWNFPKPKNGVKVVVTYPFLFKSTH